MNKNRNWYRNIGKSEPEDPSPTETRREGFPERYSRSWRLAEWERPVSVPITGFSSIKPHESKSILFKYRKSPQSYL